MVWFDSSKSRRETNSYEHTFYSTNTERNIIKMFCQQIARVSCE